MTSYHAEHCVHSEAKVTHIFETDVILAGCFKERVGLQS